jgi:hypothetical protein
MSLLWVVVGCGKQERTQRSVKQAELLKTTEQESITYVTWPMWEVDRTASIWLIKRYINPNAKFRYIEKGEPLGRDIPFDIPEAELQRKHNTSCFQMIMKKYNLKQPELLALSKLVWDIEINFWGDKKYSESISFKEKFDRIFTQKLSHNQTVELCCKEFDKWLESYKSNSQ